MGVRFMEHILILTQDPAGTRDWWCQTLGLREGDHPDFGFPVHWLYIGDQDVIHIGQANYSDHQNRYLANREGGGAAPDTGAIDQSASTARASRSSSGASRPPASTSASTRRTIRRCSSCSSATRSTASRSSSASPPRRRNEAAAGPPAPPPTPPGSARHDSLRPIAERAPRGPGRAGHGFPRSHGPSKPLVNGDWVNAWLTGPV
jgi:hypothetical protein